MILQIERVGRHKDDVMSIAMNGVFVTAVTVALLVSGGMQAQDRAGRYVVFFGDKYGAADEGAVTPYSLDSPEAFLSARSLARRQRYGIAVTEEDLPVNPAYVDRVARQQGVAVYYTLRWWNAALVEVGDDGSPLAALRALPMVDSLHYVAPPRPPYQENVAPSSPPPTEAASTAELANADQLAMLNLDAMHAEGVLGQDVAIAVFDAGFRGVDTLAAFAALFREGRLKDAYDFHYLSSDVFRYADHGSEALSIMAAERSTPSAYRGGAPQALYLLYTTEWEPSEYRVEEYNWMAAAERADSCGADIINSSLGYADGFYDPSMDYSIDQLDGSTAVVSRAAATALAKGMLVVGAAGNRLGGGREQITHPADVDGLIAVGAVTRSSKRVSFSLRGPTADGRIKPDVAALGADVVGIGSDGRQARLDGTSFSCPLVTSLAAGLLQVSPTLSPRQLRERIIRSGSQWKTPDNDLGYGTPDYLRARAAIDVPPEEPSEKAPFRLCANPVSTDYLGIWVADAIAPSDIYHTVLRLYTLRGRRLLTTSPLIGLVDGCLRYDVALLSPGMYVAKVKNGPYQRVFKWIKK